jgi:hypothetical protein
MDFSDDRQKKESLPPPLTGSDLACLRINDVEYDGFQLHPHDVSTFWEPLIHCAERIVSMESLEPESGESVHSLLEFH